MRWGGRESGQAFPAYVAVIAGLLFLAFVYLAVGQAAALRNGAQTAADAAALGAAQDVRDQLRDGWVEVIDDPTRWQVFVLGEEYVTGRACQKAAAFASANGAVLLPGDCVPLDLRFTVTVKTDEAVGDSLVPGTADRHATATASAVVEPLCTFDPPEPSPDPTPTIEPDPSSTPSEEPEEEEPDPVLLLTCEDRDWEIDPDAPVLPGADELFRVRLTGDDE
ncbi:pilus assembly protein TadG-related protein [Streptomyces omiyaensis]|uniref:pilus assembly protein TadG-related protein n=1 Tax=Streptomyces omiyaensis TaxID=68247 RepID=UPI0036F70D8D